MPTIAKLTGADLPGYEMDGKNAWELISGEEGAENPQDYYSLAYNEDRRSLVVGRSTVLRMLLFEECSFFIF